MSFASVEYSESKQWIRNKIQEGFTWDNVKNLCVGHEQARVEFARLQDEELLIPQNMELYEWALLVSDMQKQYIPLLDSIGISSGSNANTLPIPIESSSAWVRYKNYLLGKYDGKPKMSENAVLSIEKNCHWILNHLKRDTRSTGPVKGLVMGSVQSGKTANMIGLSSMAAHYDWNIIIILSGTIENLRKQTRDRFYDDLRHSSGVCWHVLDYSSNPNYMVDI